MTPEEHTAAIQALQHDVSEIKVRTSVNFSPP